MRRGRRTKKKRRRERRREIEGITESRPRICTSLTLIG
jgi:hypothetical protein